VIFSQFWAAAHTLRVNCTEMARDRARKAACKIWALNVNLSSSNSDPPPLHSETCAREHQRGVAQTARSSALPFGVGLASYHGQSPIKVLTRPTIE